MGTKKVNGFSLLEIMVVLAILGVVSAIAIPTYQKYVVRTNRTNLQATMLQVSQKLAAYKLANNDYNTTLSNNAVYGSTVFPQTGTALYDLALDTTTVAGGWTLTATPKTGRKQAGNGAVLLNDQGWRCWTQTTVACTLSATSKWEAR